MPDQLSLLDDRPTWATGPLGHVWWDFHCAHPEVYDRLEQMSVALVQRGHDRIGIAMLWETLRYESMLGARPGEDTYRLNNNHRAYYARLLMGRRAELAGVFETRSVGDG